MPSKFAPEIIRSSLMDYESAAANATKYAVMYSVHGEHLNAAKCFAEAEIYSSIVRDKILHYKYTLSTLLSMKALKGNSR